ncbi:MAG TPA: creatininase family protein [Thermomicrobiales bacterium]|nr:creatininase family protein [Thermomicrobiales bacterium]
MSTAHRGRNLSDLTWIEASEVLVRRPIGLLPIGAIEAHGPHLPLDTDVIIATATASRALDRLEAAGTPALILPPITYSVSFVGTSFAGTTPVEPDPFEAYLTSILIQHLRQGYRAIVCCNAHLEPASVERVATASRSVTQRTGTPVLFPDQRLEPYVNLLSDEFRAGARHAGGYETSIVMATRPDAVRMDRLAGLEPVWIDLPARLKEGAQTFAEAGATLGYFGEPATSTIEEGERMLDALAEIVMIALRDAGVDLSPDSRANVHPLSS